MIIGLVFVKLVFLSSIVQGVVVSFNRRSIDYTYGNLDVEPKEGQFYFANAAALKSRIERITAGASITFRTRTLARSVVGVSPADEARIMLTSSRMIEGEYLLAGDTGSAVIGKTLAGEQDPRLDQLDSLGGVHVGNSISVAFSNGLVRRYHVEGIFHTNSFSAETIVYLTEHELASALGHEDRASQIMIRTQTTGNEDAFRNTLDAFGVQETIKTQQEKAQGIIGDVTRSFAIISLISTGVSLVIPTVMIFINTVNRQRQIGILKAIGIDKNLIVNSYVLQALFMSMAGFLFGLGLLAGVARP
ncbi:MAG: FtsX-like permease family protein [Methanospirillum sp.]